MPRTATPEKDFQAVANEGNYILNSQTVENRATKVLDSRKGVMYHKDMMYQAICVTCGALNPGSRFPEESEAVGERHQKENTFRVLRSEPLNPDHGFKVQADRRASG